ncbi:hypothetical protein KM043_016956 [Ampulex compressa]|nr:hypothetical protein KM043_016956 [Ampulex compressa]
MRGRSVGVVGSASGHGDVRLKALPIVVNSFLVEADRTCAIKSVGPRRTTAEKSGYESSIHGLSSANNHYLIDRSLPISPE